MTASTNEPTVTSTNGEIERLRAYLTAISEGAAGSVSLTWILSMANGALYDGGAES